MAEKEENKPEVDLSAVYSMWANGAKVYPHTHKRNEGIAEGKTVKGVMTSKTFSWCKDITYSVYVPAAYDGSKAAAVMVIQDGDLYENATPMKEVVDNLIASGDMPVTILVFVNASENKAGQQLAEMMGLAPVDDQLVMEARTRLYNTVGRAVQYDSLGPNYATFVASELLPRVGQDFKLSEDRKMRALLGMSSGGIVAFNAAFERPDQFSKVVGHSPSFVDIREGDTLPRKFRNAPKKDLRIWFTAGENDQENLAGNWLLASKMMDSALKWRKYDYKFEVNKGGHDLDYAQFALPETLKWVWKGWNGSAEEEVVETQS